MCTFGKAGAKAVLKLYFARQIVLTTLSTAR